MPRFTMEVPHTLGNEEATRRLKKKFDGVRADFGGKVDGLVETWDGDQLNFAFSAVGMKIAGTITVDDDKVQMAADLPFAAMMFKGVIENRIRGELGPLLADQPGEAC